VLCDPAHSAPQALFFEPRTITDHHGQPGVVRDGPWWSVVDL